MIAPAPIGPVRPRSLASSLCDARSGLGLALWWLLVTAGGQSASAQVSAGAAFTSDYQYRGISLSDGRPALSLSISYDHRSGVYAGGAVVGGTTPRNGLQVLGVEAYLGYARRFRSADTLDIGVSHRSARQFYYSVYTISDTEIYAGLHKGHFSYYLYYSPRYYGSRNQTLYADVAGSLRPAPRWRVFGHIGVLTPLQAPARPGAYLERYDFKIGLAREFRGGEVQLAWTPTLPDRNYRLGRSQEHDALVFTASHGF